MKNKLFIFLSLVSILTFTSCIEIVEEITFKEDGKIDFAIAFDASAMMDEAKIEKAIKKFSPELSDGMSKAENTSKEAKVYAIDSTMQIRDLLASEGLTIEGLKDSIKTNPKTAHISDEDADLVVAFLEENVDNMSLSTVMNSVDKVAKYSLNLNDFSFDKIKEIHNILGVLGKNAPKNPMVPTSLTSGEKAFPFKWKKNKFTRTSNFNDELLAEMKGETGEIDDFLKMILGGIQYKTVYNFPNAVKKASNKLATISDDKKTVSITSSLLELIEQKSSLDLKVKYVK